eukprot:SAG31_NODE_5265_length_2643_cov_1.481525_2_plen_236_part_00
MICDAPTPVLSSPRIDFEEMKLCRARQRLAFALQDGSENTLDMDVLMAVCTSFPCLPVGFEVVVEQARCLALAAMSDKFVTHKVEFHHLRQNWKNTEHEAVCADCEHRQARLHRDGVIKSLEQSVQRLEQSVRQTAMQWRRVVEIANKRWGVQRGVDAIDIWYCNPRSGSSLPHTDSEDLEDPMHRIEYYILDTQKNLDTLNQVIIWSKDDATLVYRDAMQSESHAAEQWKCSLQ